ncbi:hypothetical protein [Rhizomicrobium electricum]|uniref:Uncharacterized protein n=1 Tax=Rhizomicrobium electricum TaxID=480070 RepID=A0ABN1EWK9_9PROT|nr:hypothetical protein [Rhizomicrobium electricum]NIJ49997.1 hypothetical protein [Rhizomicrobium electricum]
MKRIAAVVTLALLSPLIAEYLSGSLSLAEIAAMPVMLAMYGGGAVLIRETVRRSGRGWPSILLLGLAYALVEEGIADQSLFNPNFEGLRLLDPGFLPALGIGVPWTLYVLAIHVIWSIMVPIALAESLFPSIRREPWTGRVGVAVAAFFYAGGVALITLFFAKTFFAPPAQIAASAAAAVVFVVAAFMLPRPQPKPAGAGPRPWLVGVASFAATSAFVQLYGLGVRIWPWQAVALGMVLLLVLMLAAVFVSHRRSGWTPAQIYAAAAGALLTYGWTGFFTEIALHGPAMLPAHAGLAAVMLVLLVIAGFTSCVRRP